VYFEWNERYYIYKCTHKHIYIYMGISRNRQCPKLFKVGLILQVWGTTLFCYIHIKIYIYTREWDVVRARVFQCYLVFFICFVFFYQLPHTFSVIFMKFIGFVRWYYLGIQLDSLCQLVLHVCIKI
jgi:hypothetical protein